jgi:predicted  nucleic acid-binding Zn-ribbon protein
MERIRIGTNIGIVWHIFVSAELGESFVLKDKEDYLKIYIRSPHDIYEVPYFTVEEDTIKLSFPGQFQRYTGVHAIVLKDTTDGERTVCKDFAFELVKHLEREGEAFEDNEEKKILALNSSILVSKQGESAYEVWLRLGNVGSQEDFFKWLRGGTLVNYTFLKPLRARLLEDGVNYQVSLDPDAFSEAVDGQFIRKDVDDEANGVITFNKGYILGRVLFNKVILGGEVDSTDYTDNKLMSALGVLKLLEKYLAALADKYIRKDIDDEARGLITFLSGLKSESLATFLSGMAVSGMATFKDSLGSDKFWTGWSGYGWKIWMRDTMNVVGKMVKRSTMEIDELNVRGTFRVFELVINQLRGENDNYVFSGMQKVDHVDVDTNTIYLDTNKGETYCPFREGDILRCQRFQGGDTVIKRYDILVKEAKVGDIADGEDRVDYIVWENFDGDVNDIAQGDVLCRIDNDRDPERKGIITTTSVGSNSPYIDVIYGLITNPEESLKVRLGKLDGIVNELFGELSGYGLFSNNAFLTGEFYLSTGEAVSTKIKMLENLFSSSMSKTTYDIKEDDNIVTNCEFVEDMRGWTTVDGDDMDLFFIDDNTPVFMNDDMFSDGHSVASLENVQGKDMLHLLNAGVSQDNALFVGRVPADSEVEEYVKDSNGNIIKNDDGTLKTKTKTIRPTIYISYRYMCKEPGSFSIGFNNGRTTQYSSDMGVIVSVDELGTLTENINANEGVWIERQYKGYYDKLGDFVISTTGEVYIDVLAVTSKPLEDYKNVVSTALVQTAGAIGLYGKNIRANEESIHGVGQSVTELGVVVDANKREVDLFVNTTYANDKAGLETKIENGIKVSTDGIEAVASRTTALEKETSTLKINYDSISTKVFNSEKDISELEQTASSLTSRISNSEKDISELEQTASSLTSRISNSEKDISELEQTASSLTSRISNSEKDISTVTQTANSVSAEVKNASGSYANLSLALDGIKTSVKGVDERLTTIEQTVDGIDLSVYAKTKYVDSETGEIKTKLNKSGIDIEANKITISSTGGKLVVDTTNFKLDEAGNVTVTGTINATNGTIGGIAINENSISATNFSLTKEGLLNCTNANISNTLGDNKILLGSNGTYSGLFCYDGSSELFKLIFTKKGNYSLYSPEITITSTSGYAKANLSAGGLSFTYYDSTSSYGNGFISMGSDNGEPSMRLKDRNGSYFDFGYNEGGKYPGKFIWYFSDVSVLMNSTTATKGYVYVDNGYLKIKTS